jgi:hypothetical protein
MENKFQTATIDIVHAISVSPSAVTCTWPKNGPRSPQGPNFATSQHVTRVCWTVLAIALLVSCSTDTSTHPLDREARREGSIVIPPESHVHEPPRIVPENPADRGIRRNLSQAIAGDAELKHRDISFIVSNGDVNVTGTVKSEHERERINALALNIDGVKSVANALRVLP